MTQPTHQPVTYYAPPPATRVEDSGGKGYSQANLIILIAILFTTTITAVSCAYIAYVVHKGVDALQQVGQQFGG